MPIRYIGRDPVQKAKSLYEMCRQLRDFGVGRIVYQRTVSERWPTQKSYYRLTKVIPNMEKTDFYGGEAWGIYTFRGLNRGENRILVGHKADWILVPKEEEQEFCIVTDIFDIKNIKVPTHVECPPLLEMALKNEMKVKGAQLPEKIQFPFVSDQFIKEFDSQWA